VTARLVEQNLKDLWPILAVSKAMEECLTIGAARAKKARREML
jgi:hypothetical protein